MCEPVSIISGVTGGLSAVGQFSSQQQQANAQYQAAKNQRQAVINQQRSKLIIDNQRFRTRQTDRQRADRSAGRAADKAYLDNQNLYNEKVKSFLSNKQTRTIESMIQGAKMAANGQRGGSAQMMQVANKAALGRDNATAIASLRSASSKLISDNRGIQEQLQGQYEENYSQVGDPPIPGFDPPEVAKPAGPNPLSIAAAIGQVGLGAYNAGQAAKTLPDGTTQNMAGGGDFSSFPGVNTSFKLDGFNFGN